jgi:hypothetical protein
MVGPDLPLQLSGHAHLAHLAHLHHGSGFNMPQWPPAGSMGRSPGMMMMLGTTPPMGRSVDMVDICTQLMEAGGEQGQGTSAFACPAATGLAVWLLVSVTRARSLQPACVLPGTNRVC